MQVGDNIIIKNNSVQRYEIVKVTQIYDNYIYVRHLDEDGTWIVYKNEVNNVCVDKKYSSDELERIFKENSVKFKILSMRINKENFKSDDIENDIKLCWYERNFLYPNTQLFETCI